MNTIFLNPHATDFVYKPLSFLFARKRALLKYEYLDRVFIDNLYYHHSTSSLPFKGYSKLPSFIQILVSRLEAFLWKKANNRQLKPLLDDSFVEKNIFLFGYKHDSTIYKYLIRKKFQNKLFIHLSHYHTFDIPAYAFEELDIQLFFDNDIANNLYFKLKFPAYKHNILVLPFAVSNRYLELSENDLLETKKKFMILATGTYHILEKDSIGIHFGDVDTLHPFRIGLAQAKITNPCFVNKLSLYHSSSIFGVIKGQKKYFSFDIKRAYLKASHALVAGEGTGAIAIGSLEAMACGCTVFLHESEVSQAMIDYDCDFIVYKDLKELLLAVDSFKQDSKSPYLSISNHIFVCKKFSPLILAELAAKLFKPSYDA